MQTLTPRFLVSGHSMQPSLEDHQRVLGTPLQYLFSEPQRGDIVILRASHGEDASTMVKRIIGLPGDVVAFRDTRVYINGRNLYEPYLKEPCVSWRCRDAVWMLDDGEYFVMGDNRNTSHDSRDYGPIARTQIIAKVVARIWPLSVLERMDTPR